MKFLTTRICSEIVKLLKQILDDYAEKNHIILDQTVMVAQPATQENAVLKLFKSSPIKTFASASERSEDLANLHAAILATHLHYDEYVTNLQVTLKSVSKGWSAFYSKDGSSLKKNLRHRIQDINRTVLSEYARDIKTLQGYMAERCARIAKTASNPTHAYKEIWDKLEVFRKAVMNRNERWDLLFCPKHVRREGFVDTVESENCYSGYFVQALFLKDINNYQQFNAMLALETTIANQQFKILNGVSPSNMQFLEMSEFKKSLEFQLEETDKRLRATFEKQWKSYQAKMLQSAPEPDKTATHISAKAPMEEEKAKAWLAKLNEFCQGDAHEYARQMLESNHEEMPSEMQLQYYRLACQIYTSCYQSVFSDKALRKIYLKTALEFNQRWQHQATEEDNAEEKEQSAIAQRHLIADYALLLVQIALNLDIQKPTLESLKSSTKSKAQELDDQKHDIDTQTSVDSMPTNDISEQTDASEDCQTLKWENVVAHTLVTNPIFTNHLFCSEIQEQKLIEHIFTELDQMMHTLDESASSETVKNALELATKQALNVWIRCKDSLGSIEALLEDAQDRSFMPLLMQNDSSASMMPEEDTGVLQEIQKQSLLSYQKGRADTLYLIFYTSIASYISDLFDGYNLAKKGAMRRPEDPVDQANDYVRGAFIHGRPMFGPEVGLTLLGVNKLIDWWQDSKYDQCGSNFLYSAGGSQEEVQRSMQKFKRLLQAQYGEALKYVDPEGIINLLNAAKERILEYTGRTRHNSPTEKVWLDALKYGSSRNFDHLSVSLEYSEKGYLRKENMKVTQFLEHPDKVAATLSQSFRLAMSGQGI